MKLQEFTAWTNADGSQIVRVAGRVSNHPDPEKQIEWIAFQIAVDLPTVLNGALLRAKVLEKVSEQLARQKTDFEHLGDQARSRS